MSQLYKLFRYILLKSLFTKSLNRVYIRKRPKFRFGVRLILAGSVRQKFCRIFCHSTSCSLTIYGYKADRLCNSLQQIVFSVTAKFHNTYLDNSVLRCKTFGLLRGRILYSCFDFIIVGSCALYALKNQKRTFNSRDQV